MTADEIKFLKESNAIEGVFDERSLVDATHAWAYLKKQSYLTRKVVCKTHRYLMTHQSLQPEEIGHYRTIPVSIAGRPGVKPSLIYPLMQEWIALANDKRIDPIEHHVRYEKIHPFVDGNGRTGRMFLNWMLLRQGKPIMIIEADKRHEYYQWFV